MALPSLDENDLIWDFCIATGCVVTLILAYLAQIVRVSFFPLSTRNRLTMTIWWSHFLNLLMLEFKKIAFICIKMSSTVNQLASYSVSSIAGIFYTSAILVQSFQLDMLAQMIRFQGQYHVS